MATERGVIVEVDLDNWRGVVTLDSGAREQFALKPYAVFEVGWRVLVDGVGSQLEVRLDLTAIAMTDDEAQNLATVAARAEAMIAAGPLTDAHVAAFRMVLASHDSPFVGMRKDGRMLRDRIERMLDGDLLPITAVDTWAAAARTDLATIANRDAWLALLAQSGDGAKPNKKWSSAAAARIATIGVLAFTETVRRWFALVATREVQRDEGNWYAPAMDDANSEALRNLVWACGAIDPEAHVRELEPLAVAIGDLAVRCFTKIRGVGALSTKAGNACIYVLSQLPGMRAVAQLSRLGARVRYSQALALIDKAKLECARRAGMEPIDLEELALPTFGLDVMGRSRTELGEYVAELAITGDEATLVFYAGDKRLKAAPAALKTAHADALKELKGTHKELAALIPTLRWRLERWFAEPRAWVLADLRARYLDHPLVAQLARRLIYITPDERSVIFADGFPLDRYGKQLDVDDTTMLALWHPLGRPAVEVELWRALFAQIGLVQPVKQIDREIYVAEGGTASKLFAGQRLRQHQLAALCRERGWSFRLMGGFDGANAPRKLLRTHQLDVTFDVEVPADVEVTEAGMYVYVTSGAVQFSRDNQRLALASVPARCFSEVMRDVDLFVAASRG